MKTLTEKLIESHLLEGEMIDGEEIGIRIDHTLFPDSTGTLVVLQFEAMGVPTVKTELSVSFTDHNTNMLVESGQFISQNPETAYATNSSLKDSLPPGRLCWEPTATAQPLEVWVP